MREPLLWTRVSAYVRYDYSTQSLLAIWADIDDAFDALEAGQLANIQPVYVWDDWLNAFLEVDNDET